MPAVIGRRPRARIAVAVTAALATTLALVLVVRAREDRPSLQVRALDGPALTLPDTTSPPSVPPSTTTSAAAAAAPARAHLRQCANPEPSGPEPFGAALVGIVAADGVHELAVDGSRDHKVAGTDSHSREPAWSADGAQVVFSEQYPDLKTPSGNPVANLVVADVTGRCWTALSDQRSDVYESPSWAPDGRSLAYVRHVGGSLMVGEQSARLEVSAPDGTGARVIASSRSPGAWAPDGSGRIVFSDEEGLKLRQPNGRVIVLDAVGDSEFASWSPDSKRIVFSVSTNSAVWVVNADGTGLRALTPENRLEPHAFVFFSSWSPDGARIAFTRDCCLSQSAEPRGSDLWLVNADGTGAHAVTSSHQVSGLPRWSPSGDMIAYEEKVDPGSLATAVMVIGADGTNPRLLARDASLFSFFQRGGGAEKRLLTAERVFV